MHFAQYLEHDFVHEGMRSGLWRQQQYAAYGAHAHTAASNGVSHTNREEEEEEEDDEEEVVEEELERNDTDLSQHPATNSPHQAAQSAAQEVVLQAQSQSGGDGDDSSKRKPGRPRGSRNRKPKTFNAVTQPAPKAPLNSHHPGFYQYPPAPGSTVNPNQQFYEFQWRALNLCSEFYNAAEELVKAASPIVISQCYQMGPGARVDPLAMIADAKRVCDNLLANPSQLVGQQPPSAYPYPSSYPTPYAPPAAPAPTASPSSNIVCDALRYQHATACARSTESVLFWSVRGSPLPDGPVLFIPYATTCIVLSSAGYPGSGKYFSQCDHTGTGVRGYRTSLYHNLQCGSAIFGFLSSVGQQGSWSAEEEDRLRKLAEQSKNRGTTEQGAAMGQQQTRHQILLRATALGLKESTTRATKRKREAEAGAAEANDRTPTPASHAAANAAPAASTTGTAQNHPQQPLTQQRHAPAAHAQPAHTQPAHAQPVHAQATHSQPTHVQSTHSQPTHSQTTIAPSATTTTPVSTHASPALPPQRPPSSTTTPATIAPARTTTNPSPVTPSGLPWPMPTVAANTPSPVLTSAQIDQRTTSYYRPPPTQRPSYGTSAGASTTTSYAAASTSNTTPYGAAATSRPASSHGNVAASHPYMYRPGVNGAGRRDGAPHDIGRPDVNGHYGAAPPNGQHLNQSPSGEGIQSNAGSYSPAPPVPYPGGQIYPGNVVPYGSSSLLGANVLPVSFHSSPVPPNATAPSQATPGPGPSEHPHADQSPRVPHTPTPGPSKRKSEDGSGSMTGPRKRRQYVPVGSGLDGIERDEADLGPNGGPKHWTDSEKDTLFHWLLDNDKNWDMFRSKMNTVFRDAATQVFGGRKSFTALKSCYHRNVETFKQIFAFEVYLAHNPDAGGPINGAASLGNFNDPTMARQVHLEQRLDDARAANIPVANLNVKVIDHWHQKDWYQLFKRRYVDDGTGQAVPYYGPTAMTFPDGSTAAQYSNASIDPQLTSPQDGEDDEDEDDADEQQVQQRQPHTSVSAPPDASQLDGRDASVPRPPDPNPASILAPPPLPLQPERDRRPQPLTSRRSVPSFAVSHRESAAEQTQAQMVQALERLTAVEQTLVEQIAALSALIGAQAEQVRLGGVMGVNREDGLSGKEKATLATEMLANPDVGEEVRRAAADYLKRLFLSE
ncbi:uncharacterized protein B0H18DRAFT_953885 [Fomitopsis serialis]|uniref:uncharacterized protein n=1 Tax=Fomitopsis serialis TaxID=139415 RepID=UPI002008BF42|nr:uncharacterized protein B0H18DRAFT_953885 [Neoantrodia serialis]KAH9928645.1 hypothetical protein B0H18DRAFT_953885 [Neoantrodia serialis]